MIYLVLAAVFLLVLVFIYNSLAQTKVAVAESLSGIEVQMKRRADLVPNLIEVVKGYTKHEAGVFDRVSEAREKMLSASNIKDEAAADNILSGALKSVFALAENYPDLKASVNFQSLQNDLSDIEAKISYSRQFYNNTVKIYNQKIVSFPTNLIANLFGFTIEVFFDAEEGVEKPVVVKF